MQTKKELRAEAIRRGLIKDDTATPQKEELIAEARKRGLIPEPPQGDIAIPQERVYGDPITTLRPPVTQEELERQERFQLGVAGAPETALSLGTAALAEPLAGIAGIVGGVLPGEEGQAKRAVEGTREALTYKPRGSQAGVTRGALATIFEKLPDIEKASGEFVYDLTESPLLAATAASLPTFIGELIGLKGLKALKSGTRLKDMAGRPTKALRRALDKQGLDFDQLSPQAKSLIPDEAEPGLLSSPTAKTTAEDALVKQIETGGRDDALATLDVVDGRLKNDPLGSEAVKQGFTPGFVQSVKTSNPATKEKMIKMSDMMRQIKKNERLALEFRPTDIVGESVSDRIKYIRDVASDSTKELNNIARTNLKGKQIDFYSVVDTFEDAMLDLDVELEYPKAGGKPKPKFGGSLISKDRSSQKIVNDAIDLLSEGGQPDALRAHKLKRQLDILIDFKKKSPVGLTDSGKKVLKKIRRSLNDAIRDIDPQYAAVNDKLSSSLNALDDIDTAVGNIDIFGKGSDKAIGQKMRALLSNQQGRVRLENTLDTIDSTSIELGAVFDDDIKDLVMFADNLDKRFGTTATTSFAGQITQAAEEAARQVGQGVSKGGIVSYAIRKAGEGAEHLRGINDFSAFESLNAILRK